ncbi:MAG: GNAT family N-acetyltransferase [Pseudomonadota bacterium]
MQVRSLTGEHHAAWAALRLEALEGYPQNFITTADEFRARTTEDHRAMLGHGRFRGLWDGDKLIGMAAYLPVGFASAAHRVEIGAFYITPAHHGTGAADTLMTTLIDEARSDGRRQMELFVATSNPRGKRFYERHGFTVQGLLPNAALIQGEMTSDHFMTRDLRD